MTQNVHALSLLCRYLCLPPHAAEAAIIRQLRQEIHDTDAAWTAGWAGWDPTDTAHPCTWEGVHCDSLQHITHL